MFLVVGGDSHVILRRVSLSLCKLLINDTDHIHSGQSQVLFVYLSEHLCMSLVLTTRDKMCVCGAVILI